MGVVSVYKNPCTVTREETEMLKPYKQLVDSLILEVENEQKTLVSIAIYVSERLKTNPISVAESHIIYDKIWMDFSRIAEKTNKIYKDSQYLICPKYKKPIEKQLKILALSLQKYLDKKHLRPKIERRCKENIF
jgi:hypothetical protein